MGDALGRHHSLLLDQLTEERRKKGSLEQRGIAIISTSGTLVAIVLGFVALATRNPAFVPPATVVALLVVALAGLVVAAAAGLLVNAPARMPVIDAQELLAIAEQTDWDHVDADSRRAEYRLQAQLLMEIRRVNRWRARVVLAGLLVEVCALCLMAVSAVLVLNPLT
ncbi:hypothetical protein [Amycolatopsis australiensis]|uniref:Uncharacterized protein n=1 Tax=Amycolatopsis australiensis TaxID=546364 RepID=A0A1K1RRV4_9PSEU|nr:hypothetical protein [Amycolatopsis australiensis]SFW74809.1 hypothetical protein SAMN04489730_3833 [Amycolatopsis australiensis]